MPTFADMGIHFAMFEADVSEAARWSPDGQCVICSQSRPGFTIGIGDYISAVCGHCGAATPVPAAGRSGACISCGGEVGTTELVEGQHGCWRCLHAGRWASTKDTEAGMVTPIHAAVGRTHGLPFPPGSSAETAWSMDGEEPTLAGWPVTEPNEDGWRAAIVPAPILMELVHTPTYLTWQGEQWLFHCHRTMHYLGMWGKEDFERVAEDPQEFAWTATRIHAEAWAALGDRAGESAITVYMFQCPICGTHRGHWDMD